MIHSVIKFTKATLYRIIQSALYVCAPIKRKNSRSVHVIYKPDAIGDFLLAGGVIRQILTRHQGEWVLVCSPEVSRIARELFPNLTLQLLHGSNRTDSGNALKKIRSMRSFCRTHQVETLVCLRHALTGMDHVLLNWLHPRFSAGTVGSPLIVRSPGPFRKFQFSASAPYPGTRGKMPLEVHAHLAVTNNLPGINLRESDCMPFLHPCSVEKAAPPELAVFPVTRSYLRNYPLDSLASAVNRFMRAFPAYKLCIYGTKNDEQSLTLFSNLISEPTRMSIDYPDSILSAAARIAQSSLFLGMDSAPAHIAAILDKPSVIILAGGQYNHFAPWATSDRQVWLSVETPCYFCNWNCIYNEPLCITKLTPEQIFPHMEALEEMVTH